MRAAAPASSGAHLQLPGRSLVRGYPGGSIGSPLKQGIQIASLPISPGGAQKALLSEWATNAANACEEQEENALVDQLVTLAPQAQKSLKSLGPSETPPPPPPLPWGGHWDDLLLKRGSSEELFWQLAQIFMNDPPVECARYPDKVGLSCVVANYDSNVFSPSAVQQTLGLCKGFYDAAPNILEINVPVKGRVIVVGDTHGQLEDVLWMFFKYGLPSSENQYVFDGDIVDRGGHALEILLLLFVMKRDCPDSIQIIRGNHEDLLISQTYGFSNELQSKFGANLGGHLFYMCTQQVFPALPFAAVISGNNGRIFVVHGGVPSENGIDGPITLQMLVSVNRKRAQVAGEAHGLLFNALWADPVDSDACGPSQRGHPFGPSDTEGFCAVNGFSAVVRAHQLPPGPGRRGFSLHHGGRCATVFSASNYSGAAGNKGGILICEAQSFPGLVEGRTLFEFMAPSWSDLAELFKKHRRAPAQVRAAHAQRYEAHGLPAALSGGNSSPSRSPNKKKGADDYEVAAVVRQVERSIMERIVWYKEVMFKLFLEQDTEQNYRVPRKVWTYVLSEVTGPSLPEETWTQLASLWEIEDPVPYLKFLQRFEIRTGRKTLRTWEALVALSWSLRDLSAQQTLQVLDPDADGRVSLEEFQGALDRVGVYVPPKQAATLHMTICSNVEQPLQADHFLLCLALIGMVDRGQSPLAKCVGEQLEQSGESLIQFFRKWDVDGDGFLSVQELVNALTSTEKQYLKPEEAQEFAAEIDAQTNGEKANGKVSVIQFLQAIGDRSYAKALQGALLGEVLKTLYFHRHALRALFAVADPSFSGHVSLESFTAAVTQVNIAIAGHGEAPLTEPQVQAVVEMAGVGDDGMVGYDEFLGSLEVVDTVREATKAATGCSVLRTLFAKDLKQSFLVDGKGLMPSVSAVPRVPPQSQMEQEVIEPPPPPPSPPSDDVPPPPPPIIISTGGVPNPFDAEDDEDDLPPPPPTN